MHATDYYEVDSIDLLLQFEWNLYGISFFTHQYAFFTYNQKLDRLKILMNSI